MSLLFVVAVVVAALLHLLFFLEESIWWMHPAVHRKTFGLSLEEARTMRLMAFNQGFYNLFLAGGVAFGLAAPSLGLAAEGRAVVAFALASMTCAAVVLLGSKPALWVAALIQGVPPAAALVAMALGPAG